MGAGAGRSVIKASEAFAVVEGRRFPCVAHWTGDARPIYSDGRLIDCRNRRRENPGDWPPRFHVATLHRDELRVEILLEHFGLERAMALYESGELLEGVEVGAHAGSDQTGKPLECVFESRPMRVHALNIRWDQFESATVELRGAQEKMQEVPARAGTTSS